jgi:proline racemase
VEELPDGRLIPRVSGRAWVNGESTYLVNPDDPFREGIPAMI